MATIMAETVSEGKGKAGNPPPKRRRRILDPKAIVPVPVYSNKVNSSLQLKPMAAVLTETEKTDEILWSEFSCRGTSAAVIALSDSEEDEAQCIQNKQVKVETIRCPSPPPPESPVKKQSRKVKKKISELDRNLRAMNSLLSPEPQSKIRTRSRRGPGGTSPVFAGEQSDEDVIVVAPDSGSESFSCSATVREIPLKIRCRTEVHKIPVLPSTTLCDVVTRLSIILNVPPPRLLLLREELELPTKSTVAELGLGIADIIECVVMAAEDKSEAEGTSNITVRLQGKDRDSSQEFSLHRDAPLGPIFSQYLSKMPGRAQRDVRFHFDGSKVTHSQTPTQLGMEDGDIIEVWT